MQNAITATAAKRTAHFTADFDFVDPSTAFAFIAPFFAQGVKIVSFNSDGPGAGNLNVIIEFPSFGVHDAFVTLYSSNDAETAKDLIEIGRNAALENIVNFKMFIPFVSTEDFFETFDKFGMTALLRKSKMRVVGYAPAYRENGLTMYSEVEFEFADMKTYREFCIRYISESDDKESDAGLLQEMLDEVRDQFTIAN